MGLMGPARTQRPSSAASPHSKFVKTGGAGNMGWYNDSVAQAASSRPVSAAYRAQQQQRPTSARPQQQQQLAPTQQMYPSAAAAAPAGSSARWLAQQPMTEAAHEEDCICTVWSVLRSFHDSCFFPLFAAD